MFERFGCKASHSIAYATIIMPLYMKREHSLIYSANSPSYLLVEYLLRLFLEVVVGSDFLGRAGVSTHPNEGKAALLVTITKAGPSLILITTKARPR